MGCGFVVVAFEVLLMLVFMLSGILVLWLCACGLYYFLEVELMEREKEIEARLKQEVEKMGGWCLKFVSPGRSGVPDRLVLLPGGRVVFVELKKWGEKPRPLQERVIAKLRNLGFEVWVLDDKKEIGKLLQQVVGEEGKGAEKT